MAQTSAERLLAALEERGFLAADSAAAARDEFATLLLADSGPSAQTLSLRFVSFANFVKIVGVCLLLAAFYNAVFAIVDSVWWLVAQVPVAVYQTIFLCASVSGMLCAPWRGLHGPYIAIFCAFATIIVIFWTVFSHEALHRRLVELREYMKSHGPIHFDTMVSLIGVVYFGVLALTFSSEVFGFFTVVCLSAVTTFGLRYEVGVLTLYFGEEALFQVVAGNFTIVAAFTALQLLHSLPPHAQLFQKGVHFYSTVAAGTGFIVGASPYRTLFGKDGDVQKELLRAAVYAICFANVLLVAMGVYFLAGVKVIGSILCVFAALLALEWVWFLASFAGAIAGLTAVGLLLYGSVSYLERPYVRDWIAQHWTQVVSENVA